MRIPSVALLLLPLAPVASAQTTLLVYDPVGPQGSSSDVAPATTSPVLSASDLTQEGFGGWVNTNIWPVGQIGAASPTVDPLQYLSFEITPSVAVDLAGLTYSRNAYNGDSCRQAAVRTSLDGFATDVDVLTGLNPAGTVELVFDLSSLPPLIATTEIRIYFYDAPTAGLDWADLLSTAVGGNGLVVTGFPDGPGDNYCGPGVVNSSGDSGTMGSSGSASVAANDLVLTASGLPANQFGIFVVSDAQGFVPGANGSSNGNLCLSGAIGRYSIAGEIFSTGANGETSFPIDLNAIRRPAGNAAGVPGETWYFQAWHRDIGGQGSNFTDGLSVTLI